jgi:hypothetical protein
VGCLTHVEGGLQERSDGLEEVQVVTVVVEGARGKFTLTPPTGVVEQQLPLSRQGEGPAWFTVGDGRETKLGQ